MKCLSHFELHYVLGIHICFVHEKVWKNIYDCVIHLFGKIVTKTISMIQVKQKSVLHHG